MRKIIIAIAATVALAGCATNQQSGQAIGAVTGALVGHTVGKGFGNTVATVVGAAVGAEVGRQVGESMDRPRETVVVHQTAPVVVERQVYVTPRLTPDYSVCEGYWRYEERRSCQAGVEQAFRQEMNKRKQDAYRRGLKSPQGSE